MLSPRRTLSSKPKQFSVLHSANSIPFCAAPFDPLQVGGFFWAKSCFLETVTLPLLLTPHPGAYYKECYRGLFKFTISFTNLEKSFILIIKLQAACFLQP